MVHVGFDCFPLSQANPLNPAYIAPISLILHCFRFDLALI